MEPSKNLCAQLPLSLHNHVREEQEKTGQTLSAYITEVLTQYYDNKKEEKTMEYTRTLAFQIPEDLFFRIKDHLDRETARTGKKLTQKEFVLGLIERPPARLRKPWKRAALRMMKHRNKTAGTASGRSFNIGGGHYYLYLP